MVIERLRPPPVEATGEVEWALARAFARFPASAADAVDGRRVVSLAVTHDLAARIAARTPFEQLRDEIGYENALELAKRQLIVEAAGERLLDAARDIAARLQAPGIPVAVVKFAALRLGGHVGAGARAAGDLDLLVPAAAAGRVRTVLLDAGYREVRLIDVAHHLSALVRADGVAVEVHTALPNVDAGGDGGGFDALLAAGLLKPATALPASCLVPSREVLAAHCLVHGLVQHLGAPQSYPAMRMLADLVDLGLAGPLGDELGEQAGRLVSRSLAREDVEAAKALCRALVAGAAAALLAPGRDDPPARLLRHVLAGAVDSRYRDTLRWRAITGLDGPRRSLRGWLGELRQAVFITRGQVEVMHGPQRGEWGYAFWRLLRPLQLMARLPRYAWQAARHRLSLRATGR